MMIIVFISFRRTLLGAQDNQLLGSTVLMSPPSERKVIHIPQLGSGRPAAPDLSLIAGSPPHVEASVWLSHRPPPLCSVTQRWPHRSQRRVGVELSRAASPFPSPLASLPCPPCQAPSRFKPGRQVEREPLKSSACRSLVP